MDVLAVLLQDLPKRMSRRLLRSVTWTEVDAVFAAESPLGTLPGRVARLGRRLVNLRAHIPWISRHSSEGRGYRMARRATATRIKS
jgi:hypothetical protein